MNRYFLAFLALSFAMFATGCQKQSHADQRIQVVMRKYAIEPAVINVKSGQITELDVSTADVQHGFDVPDLHIKEPVRSGQPAVIILNHPPKGEYKVVCGIICGPHHEDMVAKIVVE